MSSFKTGTSAFMLHYFLPNAEYSGFRSNWEFEQHRVFRSLFSCWIKATPQTPPSNTTTITHCVTVCHCALILRVYKSDTTVTHNYWPQSIFVQACKICCSCVTDIVPKTNKRWRSALGSQQPVQRRRNKPLWPGQLVMSEEIPPLQGRDTNTPVSDWVNNVVSRIYPAEQLCSRTFMAITYPASRLHAWLSSRGWTFRFSRQQPDWLPPVGDPQPIWTPPIFQLGCWRDYSRFWFKVNINSADMGRSSNVETCYCFKHNCVVCVAIFSDVLNVTKCRIFYRYKLFKKY